MAKQVTKWEAADGTSHDTEEAADAHELREALVKVLQVPAGVSAYVGQTHMHQRAEALMREFDIRPKVHGLNPAPTSLAVALTLIGRAYATFSHPNAANLPQAINWLQDARAAYPELGAAIR